MSVRNLLLNVLRLLLRLRRPAPREGAPRCVLVLQYAMPLGCCVHGTPLYEALKTTAPELHVVVATRGVGAATIQHDPHVDLILETADPMRSLLSLWRTAAGLRRELRQRGLRPLWVVQDPNNGRGRFALFAALIGVGPTIGFAGAAALYDVHLACDDNISLIDNSLRLPARMFAPGQHIEPAVYFTEVEAGCARALLGEGEQRGPIVAFAVQGSGGQRTAWFRERFAAVIAHVERSGFRTVVVGTATDAPAIDASLREARSSGLNLAGKTSVPELAALLCLCDFMVAIDTGSMHVGRAAQVPLVVLGTCWQQPVQWLPIDVQNARVVRAEGVHPATPNYHMDEIEVAAVTAAVDELIRAYPPSAEAREARVQRLLSSMRS